MTRNEYIIYSIKNKLLSNLDWYYTFMAIINSKDYSNQYLKVNTDGTITLNIEGVDSSVVFKEDYSKLYDYNLKHELPILGIKDIVNLPKGVMSCVKKDITTTVGYVVLNYILVDNPFEGKIDYIEDGFDIGKYEQSIGELLTNNIITVQEYKKFVNNCGMLEKLARIVTVSATEKGITPPKGINEFKSKTIKEFDTKYGTGWRKDPIKIVEYESVLKGYMEDWLKDDPANNKFLVGKVKNNSLTKRYLTFGLATGFEAPGEVPTQVDESLLEGYPKDKVKLAKMFNTSRSASFDRGSETQKGGATAKDILRSTSSIKILQNDCGVSYGKPILVKGKLLKTLIGRYIILSGKSTALETSEDVKKYEGKVIEIRSPQYCKNDGVSICSICAGKTMAKYESGVSLVETDISATILINSLKKMHNSTISTVNVNLRDMVKE